MCEPSAQHEQGSNRKTGILETALEHMDQGISVVDADLNVVAFNQKFLDLLELNDERFKPGFPMAEAFRCNAERGEYGEGDTDELVRERIELAKRFEAHKFERARPDGTILEVHGQPLEDGGFVTTYTDVTERKRTEEALRLSEQRQALILEALAEGIYEWDIEKDALFVSPRLAELLNLRDDQLGPGDWNALVHPDDFEKYRHALMAHFKGHAQRLECEYRLRWENDEYRWFSDRGVAIRNDAGRAVKLVGAIMDITDRKRAERRIAEKDAQLELALTHMPGGMMLGDREMRYVLFNKKYLELHDFPNGLIKVGNSMRDEAMFQARRGDFGARDAQGAVEKSLDVYRKRVPASWERNLSDGRTLQFNLAPTPDGGYVTIVTDISSQKRMEASLKTSEERHSLAMRAVNEAIYDWHPDTDDIYYSPRIYEVLGHSLDELRTVADWHERIHPEDLPSYKAAVRSHLKGETERLEIEYRYRGGDGGWRWARQHGLALRDETGHVYRMAGSTGDITAQKELEAELEALRIRVVDAIETLDAGFLMWDADDRLYLSNSKYAEFLSISVGGDVSDILVNGIEFEEFMREPYRRGLYRNLPNDRDQEEWLAERIEQHRNPTGPREHQMAREGIWLHINERKTRHGDTVAIYTDITQLKRREEELRESEERYALAMRGSNEGLWDWNLRSDEVYISPYIEELFALKGRNLKTSTAEIRSRIHPDDLQTVLTAWHAHLNGKTDFYTCEYRVLGNDDNYRWIHSRGLCLKNDDGDPYRASGSIGDISERKEAEVALREAREMARQASEAKSDFVASMSHELRTPLNAIIGITEMLAEEAEESGDGSKLEPLERVGRAGRHLLELINEVLDLSKVEAGRMELNVQEFELAGLIDDVVATAEALTRVKNNRLTVSCPDEPGSMSTDQTRMRQVILNLVSNACKFTQDGTVGLTLEQSPRSGSPGISISVSDTGIGMTPEQIAIVFEPFSQGATTTAERFGGTGLGMTISREFCRMMGGDITVESQSGTGTTFNVWLPRDVAMPATPASGA